MFSMRATRQIAAASGAAFAGLSLSSCESGTARKLEDFDFRLASIESRLGTKSTSKMTLYSNLICPFAHRAHLAALEKNAPFDFVYVPLSGEIKKDPSLKKPAIFLKEVNPSGTVPAIVFEGTPVNESDICAEFIDNAYGDPLLVPLNPLAAAKVRTVNKVINPMALYKLLMNQDPAKDKELAGVIEKQLAQLEELIDGPYFLGDEISLAEVLLVPFLDRFRYLLQHYRGYELLTPGSKMATLLAAFEQRESFKETAMSEEFYLKSYLSYAGERGRSVM